MLQKNDLINISFGNPKPLLPANELITALGHSITDKSLCKHYYNFR